MSEGDASGPPIEQRIPIDHLDLHELEPAGERGWSVARWFLVSGNRLAVTGALLGLVFLSLVVGGRLWPFEMARLFRETNTVQQLFNTILSGIILLVSVVVSINAVAVSQELGSLGTHFERIQESLTFRQELEEVADDTVSPSEADRFLGFVLETLHRRLLIVQEQFDGHPNDDLQRRVQRLVDIADEDLHAVADRLNAINLERPNVLLAGMEFDYATHLYTIRFLLSTYGNDMSDGQRRALQEFAESLHYFAASREYFKTLFYKRELAALSSTLLYVSLPTILFLAYVLLAVDARMFPELTFFGLPILLLYVSIAFTIAMAPYLVLTAYVSRAAFVSRRSLEIGSFMAKPDVEKPEIDWDE